MSDEDHTKASAHEASLDETDGDEEEPDSPVDEGSNQPGSDESPAEELETAVSDAENVIDVDAENAETRQKHVITGGDFECDLDLDRETTATFLEDLAHQLRTGRSLTVSGDDWEIPFEYAEPIEVEIEHEGGDDDEARELEIEIEFEWDADSLEVR